MIKVCGDDTGGRRLWNDEFTTEAGDIDPRLWELFSDRIQSSEVGESGDVDRYRRKLLYHGDESTVPPHDIGKCVSQRTALGALHVKLLVAVC
jgi:hypothetical protein